MSQPSTFQFPARLHVLLAHGESSKGLVIRRGPSKSVASFLWDRENDRFSLGQWLRGRIYERRSDLSPDGRHWIYFAMNGKWDSPAQGSWTAIAKAPYLKAIALFAKGDGWHGGGLFTGNRSYWLNNGYGHTALRNTTLLTLDPKYQPPEYYGGECPGVYYVRLQRDGWTLIPERSESPSRWSDITTFEKPLAKGWILRKLAHAQLGSPPGKGCYWDEHEIERPQSGERLAFADWEWADWDRPRDRLVWAAQGRLWAAQLSKAGLAQERMLHDFNPIAFQAIAAPY